MYIRNPSILPSRKTTLFNVKELESATLKIKNNFIGLKVLFYESNRKLINKLSFPKALLTVLYYITYKKKTTTKCLVQILLNQY